MIQTKADYLYYLNCDKKAMRKNTRKPRYLIDIIWTFLRLMRKCEYYENCRHGFFSTLYLKFLKYRYVLLSHRLGFSIGYNTCGPGLCIEHYGNVVINKNARIGKNCRIIGSVVIGATEDDRVPTIGDNVYVGFGAAIIGHIKVANDVVIGANAVVVHDIVEEGCTYAGVPAKKISNNSSLKYITH